MIGHRHRMRCWLLALVGLAAALQGCSEWKPRLAPPPRVGPPVPQEAGTTPPGHAPSGFLMHRVQWPGESLSIIAKWYTGDYRNWRQLLENTPELKTTRIAVGDRVRIPGALVKNATPMPRSFVDRHFQTPAAGPAQAGEPPPAGGPDSASPPASAEEGVEEEYTPVPFGPKAFSQP